MSHKIRKRTKLPSDIQRLNRAVAMDILSQLWSCNFVIVFGISASISYSIKDISWDNGKTIIIYSSQLSNKCLVYLYDSVCKPLVTFYLAVTNLAIVRAAGLVLSSPVSSQRLGRRWQKKFSSEGRAGAGAETLPCAATHRRALKSVDDGNQDGMVKIDLEFKHAALYRQYLGMANKISKLHYINFHFRFSSASASSSHSCSTIDWIVYWIYFGMFLFH